MSVITEEAVVRRLQDVRSHTQESIETISLWIMHYKDKASIDIIVDGWLTCFKMATTDEQRISLFYIMNDVVQRAKNKHVDTLIPAFQPSVLNAVSLGRSSEKVKKAMDRCIKIFGERQVFTSASVTAMHNLLNGDESGDGDDSCVELDNDDIIKKIEAFEKGREITVNAMELMKCANFSFKDQIKERMRGRAEGAQLEAEVKQSLACIVSLRHSMETQRKKMLNLVEMLELAKRIFTHQLREVTVVEDAYQKFWHGIRDVHSELKEMQRTKIYPGATPPRDAPSPTANDDIYATGVETVLDNLRTPGVRDNLEATDMEIGNEDDDTTPLAGGAPAFGGSAAAVGRGPAPFTELPPPPLPPPSFALASTSTIAQRPGNYGEDVFAHQNVSLPPPGFVADRNLWEGGPPPPADLSGPPPPMAPPPLSYMQGVAPPSFAGSMRNMPPSENQGMVHAPVPAPTLPGPSGNMNYATDDCSAVPPAPFQSSDNAYPRQDNVSYRGRSDPRQRPFQSNDQQFSNLAPRGNDTQGSWRGRSSWRGGAGRGFPGRPRGDGNRGGSWSNGGRGRGRWNRGSAHHS